MAPRNPVVACRAVGLHRKVAPCDRRSAERLHGKVGRPGESLVDRHEWCIEASCEGDVAGVCEGDVVAHCPGFECECSDACSAETPGRQAVERSRDLSRGEDRAKFPSATDCEYLGVEESVRYPRCCVRWDEGLQAGAIVGSGDDLDCCGCVDDNGGGHTSSAASAFRSSSIALIGSVTVEGRRARQAATQNARRFRCRSAHRLRDRQLSRRIVRGRCAPSPDRSAVWRVCAGESCPFVVRGVRMGRFYALPPAT